MRILFSANTLIRTRLLGLAMCVIQTPLFSPTFAKKEKRSVLRLVSQSRKYTALLIEIALRPISQILN